MTGLKRLISDVSDREQNPSVTSLTLATGQNSFRVFKHGKLARQTEENGPKAAAESSLVVKFLKTEYKSAIYPDKVGA